jgi:quinol monooxygenase YgiN
LSEMSVTRISEFQALDGKGERLRALLTAAVPAIRSSKGCHSCRLLQSQSDPGRILVIEVWDSVDAHQASVKSIPPEMVDKTRSLLAAAPKAGYYAEQAT